MVGTCCGDNGVRILSDFLGLDGDVLDDGLRAAAFIEFLSSVCIG